ncbi:MAG: hypothetical protein VX268_07020, partial [Actinomycetota bacterium]|nr:hypothetical protein [Actinomycetota bacterium]
MEFPDDRISVDEFGAPLDEQVGDGGLAGTDPPGQPDLKHHAPPGEAASGAGSLRLGRVLRGGLGRFFDSSLDSNLGRFFNGTFRRFSNGNLGRFSNGNLGRFSNGTFR